jgi:hypothetical protein
MLVSEGISVYDISTLVFVISSSSQDRLQRSSSSFHGTVYRRTRDLFTRGRGPCLMINGSSQNYY